MIGSRQGLDCHRWRRCLDQQLDQQLRLRRLVTPARRPVGLVLQRQVGRRRPVGLVLRRQVGRQQLVEVPQLVVVEVALRANAYATAVPKMELAQKIQQMESLRLAI